MLNETRTEEDFAENIDRIIETDPNAGWIFVTGNLNTHLSVMLVLLVSIWCAVKNNVSKRAGDEGGTPP